MQWTFWVLLIAILSMPPCGRADTVASLLGNFTINQFCGLDLADGAIQVHFVVVYGQLPALSELHRADANGDGVTTQTERDAYVQRLTPAFAHQLQLTIDGVSVPLHLTDSRSSLPIEQGGFSFRIDADYMGALPAGVASGNHRLQFNNENFSGRFGWHEITVSAPPTMRVFNTNGFNTSLTAALTQALRALPPTGPLDERALQLSFTRGAMPAGTVALGPRPGAPKPMQPMQRANDGGAWLQQQTRALVDLISAPHVAFHIVLLSLLVAVVLGALHAFSPGHGKTIVGAYLIGSRGTPRHAVFLGLTVTITHTLGVFALGFATLFASRFVVPERLFPVLSLLSGLIVLGMGMILLAQRWRIASSALAGRPLGIAGSAVAHFHGRQDMAETHDHHDVDHAHAHGHSHDHDHGDLRTFTSAGALMHSHGGRMHSHLPGDTTVTWRSLLALGISGGLIPCPSAMVLLLAAVALNKTAYGMLLVCGFSVGLAMTLTGVGFAFLYAGRRFRKPSAQARWPHLLPVMSATAITVIGLVLCFGALQSARF